MPPCITKPMIVIKATLRDETRRLTFDSHGFPHYDDIQERLRAIFNLPSTAHPFWVNVLFFPDDAKPSRIKFKQHVCDAAEYERGQQPFLRLNGFPNPVLVFTILLSSDTRLHAIHDVHRASTMQDELRALDTNIAALEEDMNQKCQLLVSLESKREQCQMEGDNLGVSFWSDRVEEKRRSLPHLEEQLRGFRVNRRALATELHGTKPFTGGVPLCEWAEAQERNDATRLQETNDELTAWQIEHNDTELSPFPPLDAILRGATRHGHGPRRPLFRPPYAPSSNPHPAYSPTSNSQFRPTRDMLRPDAAAREVGAMLDRFLVHFQGQLVDTLDGFAARISPAADTDPASVTATAPAEDLNAPHVPGAFVQTSTQPQSDAQVQTAQERKPKPSSKPGKGGFKHKSITCDGCLQSVRGMRYKCNQCCDYDLCGACLPLLHTEELHPPTHTFKAMLHRGLEDRIQFGGTEPTRSAPQASRHPATCDLCSQNIVGVRYKCTGCEDWDCCADCAKTLGTTHPGHSFVKLHKPSDYVPSKKVPSHVTHAHVICDGCNETIRGVRYKCMMPECPDYDLCERCESKPGPVHPDHHAMLRLKTPLRVSVQSSFDQINEVYDDHHRRYRIGAPRQHGPLSIASHSDSGTASTSGTQQPGAYERGGQYAQAMDALLASMTTSDSIRVPGGYVVKSTAPSVKSMASSVGVQSLSSEASSMKALVKTEEEEMASLAAPMIPKVISMQDDRSVTPVTVGAFPVSPKLPGDFTVVSPTIPSAPVLESPSSSVTGAWKTVSDSSYKTSGPTGRPFATPPKEMAQVKSSPVTQADAPEEPKEDPIVALFSKATTRADNDEAEDPILKIIANAAAPAAETLVIDDPITTVIAAASPPTMPTKEPISPSDIFTWVRHSTIPTGTTLPAGAEFTKTWTVRHYAAGSEFAFDRIRLVHKSDGLLGAGCKTKVVFTQSDIVDGADMEVSLVGLVVPDLPGQEVAEMWRFEDDKGTAYGQPLRVRINVEEVSTGESSLASSAVVLPAPAYLHSGSFYDAASSTKSEDVVDHVSEHPAPSARQSSMAPSMDGADLDEIDASSAFSFSDLEDEPVVTAPASTYYASSRHVSSTALSDDYDFLDEPAHVAESTDEDL